MLLVFISDKLNTNKYGRGGIGGKETHQCPFDKWQDGHHFHNLHLEYDINQKINISVLQPENSFSRIKHFVNVLSSFDKTFIMMFFPACNVEAPRQAILMTVTPKYCRAVIIPRQDQSIERDRRRLYLKYILIMFTC